MRKRHGQQGAQRRRKKNGANQREALAPDVASRFAGYRATAEQTAREQREIQVWIDRKDAQKHKSEKGKSKQSKADSSTEKAVQAGDRPQPDSPMPAQHLAKPGDEHEMAPEPNYK